MQKNKSKGGLSGPPLLVLTISVLMIVPTFLNFGSIGSPVAGYVAIIVLNLLIFGVPAALYCFIRGKGLIGKIRLSFPKKRSLAVTTLCAVLLMLQSCILKFGVFYFGYDYSAYRLYGSSFSVKTESLLDILLPVIALAIVPAIAEEFVFRGIVFSEYSKTGFFCSAIASSLLFAFIHFDFAQFPIYFFDGALLCFAVFLTGSAMTAVIAHIAYNIFVLFGEKYVWLFSSNPDSELLFWLILIAIYLIFAFVFLGVAEKIARARADDGDEPPATVSKGDRLSAYLSVFTAKPMLIEIGLFAVVALIDAL